MSLKMNFLIITSIVVLTIFVKMVPANLPGLYDNKRKSEYPNKHIVSCEELYKFNEMNKKEIISYSEKTGLSNIHSDEQFKLADLINYIAEYRQKNIHSDEQFKLADLINYIAEYRQKNKIEQPDIAATILYIKDNLIRYNTYNPDISIGANVFVEYSLMKNNDYDAELLNQMEEFKNLKENDLKGLFQALTSCYLTVFIGNKEYQNNVLQSRTLYYPENAETFMDTFFLNQFRFFYNLSNAEISVIGYRLHVSVEELIQKVTHVNECLNDDYYTNEFIRFTSIWQLYKFDINIYLKYKKIDLSGSAPFNYDEYTLDGSDGERLTALEAFKKYFKESLDESYNIVLNMDINVLDESKKNNYYKRTLRTLKNIFQAHFEEIETEASSKFVLRMVSIAKKILTSDKTKQKPVERKNEYLSYKDVCPKPYKPESDNKSDIKITIKNDYYTCDSTKCALPDTVNCKDVLNYMIAHYEKEMHDFRIL